MVPIEGHQLAAQEPIGERGLGARNHDATVPLGACRNTTAVAPGINVELAPRGATMPTEIRR
eukprot:15358994-Alexandrium_andersonii.AAC.1